MRASPSPGHLPIALIWCAVSACAHDLPPVFVTGLDDPAVGMRDAASQGVVPSGVLRHAAWARPGDVLEHIPGMVVTQHSGEGKAHQFFLRGMNLDHGSDFATTINGVPVNLPTHAHGQGYSDLNPLIPELVQHMAYRKGPYFASEGDFSSAGSVHIVYRTQLDRPFAAITLGAGHHLRGVAAGSREVADGVTLLSAVERTNHDGPWRVPEGMRKLNTLFTLSAGTPREHWSTSVSTYSARWRATDPIAQRLIDAGRFQGQPFGRFDTLDPSDGGESSRISLSGQWRQSDSDQITHVQWYAFRYDLDLYANFTYALERANDQFRQSDHRNVVGGQADNTWVAELGPTRTMLNTLGLQWRRDHIRVGLDDTLQRHIQATVRDDQVRLSMLGLYGQNEVQWHPGLRTIVGLRADQLDVAVTSLSQAANSGQASAFKASPKTSLILGPWRQTEFFFNAGKGLHSNDARGMTARVDPRTGQPIDRVPGLVSSRGQEIGIKHEATSGLQTALTLWRLDFDSELVYVGDAGNTEAGRASQRTGVEWSHHWTPGSRFGVDLNLAWTRARYAGADPGGDRIVGAPQRVGHLTFMVRQWGPWSGSLGVRHIGAVPLVADDRQRAPASLTTRMRLSRRLSDDVRLTLDVLNLSNRKNNDSSYVYRSRVAGEPLSGVQDMHVHPTEPRSLRLTALVQF